MTNPYGFYMLLSMASYQIQIQEHKRKLLADDQHQASLEGKFSPTIETAIVDSQLECIAWDEHPSEELCDDYNCGCHDDCDCGGTFDADGLCSDCDNGHDDCDQSCFACFERSVSRAEAAYEGDR